MRWIRFSPENAKTIAEAEFEKGGAVLYSGWPNQNIWKGFDLKKC